MYYLYGKSIQNCRWELLRTEDDYGRLVKWINSRFDIYPDYFSYQITEEDIYEKVVNARKN